MDENVITFTKKLISIGSSLGLTIPDDIVKFENLTEEDTIKVMFVKLQKKTD